MTPPRSASSWVGRVGVLLLLLLGGWLLCWAVPGLLLGKPTALLAGTAPKPIQLLYLVLLYLWLVGATAFCWGRWGPRQQPAYPGPAVDQFWLGLAIGLISAGVHRLLLTWAGWWTWSQPTTEVVLATLVAAPALAMAEEFFFRGYLFGVAREGLGRWRAYLGVNLFFALVHLFRPGGVEFKAAYGVGLFLSGVVLCMAVERWGSLWVPAGMHAAWIAWTVVEGPRAVQSGLVPGMEGEPAAGVLGWVLLLGLAGLISGPSRAGRSGLLEQ